MEEKKVKVSMEMKWVKRHSKLNWLFLRLPLQW